MNNKKFNDTNIFFEKINEIIKNIQKIFFDVNDKIQKIQKIYQSLMHDNTDKLSLYGLDTLNFQSKLFQLQIESCDNMYKILKNRIYGDYFKLYKIIINTCTNSNITDEKIISFLNKEHNISIYKDLEPTKEYSENDLFIVHESINQVITLLNDYVKSRETIDAKHQDLIKNGFKINSFVYAYNYHNYLLKNQLELYLNYLDFYNHNHLKYFNKIKKQSNDILNDINNEIVFDKNNIFDKFNNNDVSYNYSSKNVNNFANNYSNIESKNDTNNNQVDINLFNKIN